VSGTVYVMLVVFAAMPFWSLEDKVAVREELMGQIFETYRLRH
jgi:hypothetical protein